MARELNEIKKKKELPPIVKRKSDPAAKYRSKAEQVVVNKREQNAKKKGEEAYKKAMEEALEPEVSEEKASNKKGLIEQKQLLKTLSNTAKTIDADIKETPAGEQRPLKMQLGKVKVKIKKAEDAIAELEAEADEIKE